MDDFTILEAKSQLEDLLKRAAAGEDVRIHDPAQGTFKIAPLASATASGTPSKRRIGHLKGKMTVPARLLEPMTDKELQDWYGAD